MSEEQSENPLLEWNRLNKYNAEQELTSAMFASILSTSPIVDRFSIWLLAGTGAAAALLVTSVQDILPFLSETGFKTCGAFLVISVLLGFMAKYKAISCQISYEIDVAIRKAMIPILQKHKNDEEKISEYAAEQGINLDTELDMGAVLKEFGKPFPWWVNWLINRNLRKHEGNQQMGYIEPANSYFWQCNYTLLQVLSFIAFVTTGVLYANPI